MDSNGTSTTYKNFKFPDLQIDGLEELKEMMIQFQELVERLSNFKIKTTPIIHKS